MTESTSPDIARWLAERRAEWKRSLSYRLHILNETAKRFGDTSRVYAQVLEEVRASQRPPTSPNGGPQ